MLLNLPGPVAAYLAAEKAKDAESLDRCFSADAIVHDEGRDHRGIAAIKAWKQEVDAKYRYVLEPLAASGSNNQVTLRARLTGQFPGSPVEVDFLFTVGDDKITSLEIG
jgi:hypothetical protein